jgi:CTP:phosphocholine cytidylyltransferase-like protein
MQKRILKIMKKGDKFKETENMYKYWDILLLKKQANLSLIIEKYNVNHGELNTFDYCTRLSQKENLVTPKVCKQIW